MDGAGEVVVRLAVEAGAAEEDGRGDAVDADEVRADAADAVSGGEPEFAVAGFPAGGLVAADAFAGGEAIGAVEAEPVEGLGLAFGSGEEFGAACAEDAAERAEPEVAVSVVEDGGEAEVGEAVVEGEAVPVFSVPEGESPAEGGDPDFVVRPGEDAGDPPVAEG